MKLLLLTFPSQVITITFHFMSSPPTHISEPRGVSASECSTATYTTEYKAIPWDSCF